MGELKHYRLKAETGYLGAAIGGKPGFLGTIVSTVNNSGGAKIGLDGFDNVGLDVRGEEFTTWLAEQGLQAHVLVTRQR